MIRNHLRQLLAREPFEPFRIRLLSDLYHDVFDPATVVVEMLSVLILPHDQNWLIFPLDKINCLESLIADYQGELSDHQAPST